MSIDISSLNDSIASKISQCKTSGKDSVSVNQQIRNLAKDFIANSSNPNCASHVTSALSNMKTTNGMSAIEKYKYILEQAKNSNKVDTEEPNAEKLLSESEKVIQMTLARKISQRDSINLREALMAKQIALSRLNLLG